MNESTTLDLEAGRLYALTNPYELNGRVSTHPPTVRGYASMNVYVLVDGADAVVVDTGFSVHQQALLDQLDALLVPGTRFAMCLTRPGEFNGVCNVRPIVERYAVHTVFSLYPRALHWADIRPDLRPWGAPVGDGALAALTETRVRPGDTFPVRADGGRIISVIPAPMQLLPTFWLYDEATRTLFSGELFSWVTRQVPDGPWHVMSDDDDPIGGPEAVAAYLSGSRFWWLPGATTNQLRRELAAIFEAHDIETIAPGWGALLRGADVVERHYTWLDRALVDAPGLPSIGIEVGRRRTRA